MTLKLAALPDTFAEFINEYHKLLIAKFKAEAKNSNQLELDSYDFLLDVFAERCGIPPASMIAYSKSLAYPHPKTIVKIEAVYDGHSLAQYYPRPKGFTVTAQNAKRAEYVARRPAVSKEPGKPKVKVTPKETPASETPKQKRPGTIVRERRIALGLNLRDVAEGAGVDMRLLRKVEDDRVCSQKTNVIFKVDQYLNRVSAEKRQAPHGTIAKNEAGGWGWINSTSIPAGQTMTFRILPADGVKFTPEELAAFPAFRPEPKPYLGFELPPTVKEALTSMEQVEFVPTNQTWATQAQLEAFADELGQSILQSGLNFRTWTWATFHAALFELTGCGMFNHDLLASCLSNSVLGGRVEFLISYGNNSVLVCKDANFAPVEID